MSRIHAQPPDTNSFDYLLEYARKHNYNVEIASFVYSDILDTCWQDVLEGHKRKLVNLRGKFLSIVFP